MPQPQVKCSVSNCNYWSSGNNCSADLIMIDVDAHANANYKAEFAGESFDTERQEESSKASNTCCHTFEKKK